MFISIITVTYNAEKYIERTLQSVESQNFTDYEQIIIDGASTDRTLEIAKKFPHVTKIISEKDNGLYYAMNKAFNVATGDYLLFLNAGDTLHAETVLNRLKSLSDDADIIYGDTMIVDNDGKEIGLRKKRPPKELTWQSFKDGMLVCHQSFLARRELCPQYDTDYHFSADFDWCIKTLKKAQKIVNSNILICNYLKDGMTTKHHLKSLLERFTIMLNHYGLAQTLKSHLRFLL